MAHEAGAVQEVEVDSEDGAVIGEDGVEAVIAEDGASKLWGAWDWRAGLDVKRIQCGPSSFARWGKSRKVRGYGIRATARCG